jgi:hypothetical protein
VPTLRADPDATGDFQSARVFGRYITPEWRFDLALPEAAD